MFREGEREHSLLNMSRIGVFGVRFRVPDAVAGLSIELIEGDLLTLRVEG
jgi:hypothetical protein